MYIGLKAKRRKSPVFAFNMQYKLKHSARSVIKLGLIKTLYGQDKLRYFTIP